ncbi:alpha/beta fold hydrolase [Roseobacter sinensis]|uniref:Alpha/beta fold hydrolase n=1 Tax=Roseobacter sinensis TaxID=2931391 RepID=A0ABT3BFG7_9RHOB|nr:alpha/beta hydrolase [Roseobacter sp. WL0113]MCV3272335.1 alpha/beta fold hydrolase [Roseobacter sp. WL0113]
MLHTTQTGPEGAPELLFLHAVGISSWMWRDVAAALPAYRLLLIDLPGHGQSRDLPWRSLEESADKVAEAVAATGRSAPLHLAALSLGSYVGLHLCLRHPALCQSALLSGIHPGGMPKRALMKLVSALTAPLAPRPFFARRTARMMGPDVDVDGFVEAAAQTRVSAFRRATNDVVDFECPADAAPPQTRLAFIAGGREHPLIREGLATFERRFEGSVSAIVPGLGHGWAGEDPQLFARFIKAHVAGDLPALVQRGHPD